MASMDSTHCTVYSCIYIYTHSIFMAPESTEPGVLYDLLLCYRSSIQFLQPAQDIVGSYMLGFNVKIFFNTDTDLLTLVEWNSFLAKGQYVMQENFNKMFLIYLGPAIMDLKNNLTAYFYGLTFFFL